VPLIAAAPVPRRVREEWLERLLDAIQEDDPPYIESLGEHWGAHELGRHQLDGVAMRLELACPVVRTRASFHADHAGRIGRNQCVQPASRNLGLAQLHCTRLVDAAQQKRSWRDQRRKQ
jgi:hypothetical protein